MSNKITVLRSESGQIVGNNEKCKASTDEATRMSTDEGTRVTTKNLTWAEVGKKR